MESMLDTNPLVYAEVPPEPQGVQADAPEVPSPKPSRPWWLWPKIVVIILLTFPILILVLLLSLLQKNKTHTHVNTNASTSRDDLRTDDPRGAFTETPLEVPGEGGDETS